jgi:hypothetical protein
MGSEIVIDTISPTYRAFAIIELRACSSRLEGKYILMKIATAVMRREKRTDIFELKDNRVNIFENGLAKVELLDFYSSKR